MRRSSLTRATSGSRTLPPHRLTLATGEKAMDWCAFAVASCVESAAAPPTALESSAAWGLESVLPRRSLHNKKHCDAVFPAPPVSPPAYNSYALKEGPVTV